MEPFRAIGSFMEPLSVSLRTAEGSFVEPFPPVGSFVEPFAWLNTPIRG